MARIARKTVHRASAYDLAARLTKNIEFLAIELMGEPSLRRTASWRWGSRGSFVLDLQGPRRGHWFSFEEMRGGDALDLIVRQRGGDLREAMAWARNWLGDAS